MGSNFGAGTVFLILLLKEIQGSSSVLPFVFEAQPNQSKLQILKISPENKQAKRALNISICESTKTNPPERLSLYSTIVFTQKKHKASVFSRNFLLPVVLHIFHSSVHHGTELQAHFLHYRILDLGEHWAIGGHGSTPFMT